MEAQEKGNEDRRAYRPRWNKFERQENPDELKRMKSQRPRQGMELPLVRNGEVLDQGQRLLGHPRVSLRFTTKRLSATPLVALAPALTEEERGKKFPRVATFVSFYVKGADERRGFERAYAEYIAGQPDVDDCRRVFEEAQQTLRQGETENEAYLSANVPGYAQTREEAGSLSRTLFGMRRGTLERAQLAAVRELDAKRKELWEILDNVRRNTQVPHDIRELRDAVDRAKSKLDEVTQYHWRQWRTIQNRLCAHLQGKPNKVHIANLSLLEKPAKALGRDGRACALFELEDRKVVLKTDVEGRPLDADPDPICVSLEVIRKALQPENSNVLIEQDGCFAYFPTESLQYGGKDLIQHIAQNVGNGIVGIVRGNRVILVVVRKALLIDIFLSEEHYRRVGVVDMLLKACETVWAKKPEKEAKPAEGTPETAPPPDAPEEAPAEDDEVEGPADEPDDDLEVLDEEPGSPDSEQGSEPEGTGTGSNEASAGPVASTAAAAG